MESNYSLADIASVSNGGMGGFSGGSLLILIVLFLLLGGNGMFGARGDFGQYATATSQQEILFGQQFQNIDNKIDRLANGLADSTYALNNTIVGESRGIQNAVGQVRFDMANYNAGILAAIGADGEKTRAMIQQNKIETLQGRINQLELQSAMCGVVRYPNGMTYNAGNSPFCNCCNTCC